MNLLNRLTCLPLLLISAIAWSDTTDVEGRWLTEDGDGWIEIRLVGNTLEGTIAGSPDSKQREEREYDEFNPDPSLRNRRLQGLTIMTGLEYDGEGRWTGGRIYDPNSGKTYKCSLRQLDANTVKLRGYIGVSLFGRSETWTRDDE